VNNPDPIYAGPVVGAESGWPFWLMKDGELKINNRAWTLQEKVLSSRMVHFRGDQISWECKHGQAYERGDPYGGPQESLQVEKSYKSWHDLVKNYSSRKLTFSTDKLSAFAGLAKAFWLKTEERDQYLGGIWRGSLPNNLLWYVSPSTVAARVPDPDQPLPCAPTCSWASVNQRVAFNGEGNVDIEVLECQTLSEDPFSPTVKGKLVVCGPVKKAKIILPFCHLTGEIRITTSFSTRTSSAVGEKNASALFSVTILLHRWRSQKLKGQGSNTDGLDRWKYTVCGCEKAKAF